MKTPFLVAVWLVSGAVAFCAESYQARFTKLNQDDKSDRKQVIALLAEWREKEPDNPESWIASANYYVKISSWTNITTKPAEKDDLVVSDPKTGKAVGSISTGNDPKMTKDATEFLATANTKFPDRLDIWLGLVSLQYHYGSFDDLYQTLGRMADYAKDHGENLKWLKNGKLPEPADQYVPEQIHFRAIDYYNDGTEEGLERCKKIAQIAIDHYPKHAYAFNDMAACSSAVKDYAKSREWLEKAHALDAKDTIVLLNLGDVCVKLNDKDAARKYFQQVIDLKSGPEDTKAAKDALKQLGK